MKRTSRDRARTVWIGAAGTGVGFALAEAARRVLGSTAFVIAADTNPAELVAASTIADAFERVPPVADGDFRSALVAGLERHEVDTYIPILDEEIVTAAELRDAGELPPGLHCSAPSVQVARLCFDKLASADWLLANRLPTPQTAALATAEWQPEGVFVKPRYGRGSTRTRLVESAAELDRLRSEPSDLVVQALCRAPEVTIDIFRDDRLGLVHGVCRERLEVKEGVCTKARVFADDALLGIAGAVVDGLELDGASCIQLMKSVSDDAWVVTDINPRPGAGTPISVALGIDVLSAALAAMWELDPRPYLLPLEGERHVVRVYREVVF